MNIVAAETGREPGTPLSSQEYQAFFAAMKPESRAKLACRLRQTQGCYSPKVHRLDLLENHGAIPKGEEAGSG